MARIQILAIFLWSLCLVAIRYLVKDVPQSIDFYQSNFDFLIHQQFGPAMAILRRGDLELWLAGPLSSAAKPLPNGETPVSGGWNRFVYETSNLDQLVNRLKESGVKFKSEPVVGPGGKQVLCSDPSGNLIEIFEPAAKT